MPETVNDTPDHDPVPFSNRHLRELLREREGPAISIFLPISGPAPDRNAHRLRLRSVVDRAAELLRDATRPDADTLLEPLHDLVDRSTGASFGGTLAIFRAPEFLRLFRVSATIPELVVVGGTFHTRPLVRQLQTPDRFWVLELGQGAVRLWDGDGRTVRPVEPNPLPDDLDAALGYEYSRTPEMVHRSVRAGGAQTARRAQGGGSSGTFSGHGVGDDGREPTLRRFFRAVDTALGEYLGSEQDPVVLAAVGEHHSRYRSVTGLQNLTPTGIEGSIRSWSPERLHETAWPLALQVAEARLDAALDLWERAYSRGKAESDLAALSRLAVAGRVRTLLIERDRRLWGTIDRASGDLRVVQSGGEDPASDTVELLDEVSELVILTGGDILALEPDRMPTDTGVAGILR